MTTKPVKLGVVPSTFSGRADQDPYKYLQRFELAAQANSWDETIKTAQLQNYLADTALLWLHKYLKEQNAQATATAGGTPTIAKIKWKDITEALQKAFRTVASKEVAEDKMLARKQRSGESPEDYVYAKIDLMSDYESDMDETTQVRHIVRGLKPLYFEKIYPQNLKTVEEVLNQIRRISDTQFLITKYVEVNSVEPATKAVADFSKILELQSKQHAQQMDKMMEVFTTQFKFQNNKTQNFSSQNNLVQCANCGKRNHNANQCRGQKAPKIQCMHCGKFGHIAGFCRSQQSSSIICGTCNKVGHILNMCLSQVTCNQCQRRGHLSRNCRSGNQQGRSSTNPTPNNRTPPPRGTVNAVEMTTPDLNTA
ncbi:ATP-dependent RNA helicase glh-4 [Folsomia candida]|uniref:ATP-dependent RNA helicase glh-4 n=1 Tax=Folsomia candida TaxID=158441 RepID=A0A226DJE0_FOLCA|nr:ATP-dependent RNA helicase glh-4 [Folsomia candida]